MTLHPYLPQDRLRALARGETLPDRTSGSALFADISGFTPLTETLTQELGARRGIEEVTLRINSVYEALIGEVDRFNGTVISFSGDAITCWFDTSIIDSAYKAVMCALAMQSAMRQFNDLSVKVAVTTGAVRRFATGDPQIRLIDTLAGTTVARLAAAEQLAKPGEIILDQDSIAALAISNHEWRVSETGERFVLLDPSAVKSNENVNTDGAFTNMNVTGLDSELLKPWVLPIVYERETTGQGLFLTELRPTTALFIRFMGIDYDHDPQAEEKLNAVISQTQHIVKRHGGTLLELTIGDKGSYIYSSFGASHVHEDDTQRAIRAALEFNHHFQDSGFPESIQIGVSSGTMRVGGYGGTTRNSFGALGDDVNMAARLMMAAKPGEVLISGRIQKANTGEFTVEARPPMSMKGKAEPLPVYAVLGWQQHRAIRLREPAYALPMIGRKNEMELITKKIESVSQGKGQIIGITGEAGMGKSRLVAEGIRLARRNKLTGYGGACQSDGINTPYLVWNAIWNAFFDLDPAMPLRKQIRSIEGELADRVSEHMEALPLLGAVLGLALPENEFTSALQPKDRKAQLETMLVKCLEFSARESMEDSGGLFLVLEDVHWIDPVSFDLLKLIAHTVENLPILILLTYRPPDVDTAQQTITHLESLKHFIEIKLTELDADESEQAIRAKLAHLFPEQSGGVNPLLVERITSRAQGNPFYVEELLNYLHDRGIDPRNSTALNALELPASLHSLILSRIDQLTPSQQLSLKVATIVGRVFRFEDLHNYYPSLGSVEQLKADLQVLERFDLTPLESPEPELTYLFKHIVIHEVGYESISHATRMQLHGQYAQYLEKAYPERLAQLSPQLAHHFELAQIHDKARFYLFKSGEQAAVNYANDEALSYFNRALGMTLEENIRLRFDILWRRERVYDLMGRRTDQRQDLSQLTLLANQFDNAPSLRTQIAIRYAKLEIDAGNYAVAKGNAIAAIQEIKNDPPTRDSSPDLLVDALLLEARAMFLAGQAVAAKPQLDEALALARTHQYVRGEYNALAQLGLWYWYGGDNKAAVELLEDSLALIRQAGDIRRESDILNNLGIVTKDMYQFGVSLGHYEQAQKIAKRIGDRSGEASLLNNMGRASLASGDFVNADLYCSQAAAIATDVNEPTVQGLALHNRSEAFRELGRYLDAKRDAEEALRLVRSSGYRVGEANALENLALIEFALRDRASALEHAEDALAITREIAARRVEISVLTRMGLMQLEMGKSDAAEKLFIEAQHLEQEFKEPIPIFEIQAALAEVALAHASFESINTASSHIQEFVDEILRTPATERSHILPLGLYLTAIRVMNACNDPRKDTVIARANSEMRMRADKIMNASFRASYLNIPEHRDISAFSN